ncbi:MAG: Carbohydrate-selective porin OprB, partial [Phycisphaerales bacterium]|nr:Carbohydrate-selective porin OprB [Phycisphaerales bacterium]
GSGNGAAGGGTAAPAQPPVVATPPPNDPLFGYFDAKKRLEDTYGTRVGLNIDLLSQSVILGPGSPESRFVARYDLGIHQRLWAGAEADMDVRGGWGDGPDVDYGNTVNTNQYARTGSRAFVLHLWLQQKLLDDQLTLRGGKMDVGDFMDVNRFGYYNFVGYSFAHNFAIPLPGNPLAGMFTYEPSWAKWVYVSGAVANAAQSSYRAGFEELADGPTAPFALGELGFKTKFGGQDGVYRFEYWYDGRDLPDIDGRDAGVDDGRSGVAISFDQNLTEKFGVFLRWGYGNQREFTPQQYWSAGFDWFGPIPGRPKDDLAVGVVQNIFSGHRDRVVDDPSGSETYVEGYYSVYLTQWAQVQPFVQVVVNPGGTNAETELIAGVHVALRF